LSQAWRPQTAKRLVRQRASYEYTDADGKPVKRMEHDIVTSTDEEIVHLQQARELSLAKPARKRKPLSAAARARISAAQKKWAKQKKEAASK
jgi:hypothetical protein